MIYNKINNNKIVISNSWCNIVDSFIALEIDDQRLFAIIDKNKNYKW